MAIRRFLAFIAIVASHIPFVQSRSIISASHEEPDATHLERNLQTQTIADIISSSANFSQLSSAVALVGLNSVLNGAGPYTMFAPNNDGFQTFSSKFPGLAGVLLTTAWSLHLESILTYHIVNGNYPSDYFSKVPLPFSITTLYGEILGVGIYNGFAVFGKGGTHANIVSPYDEQASNGYVHSINGIISPTFMTKTIVDVLADRGDLTTLLSLVNQVGLAETLSGFGSSGFSLFAPSDAAFSGVNTNGLTNDTITHILLGHVVQGAHSTRTLTNGTLFTANDLALDVVVINSTDITVANAMVIIPDLLANNGLIHVIDAVLQPETRAPVPPTPSPTTSAPTMSPSSSPTFGPQTIPEYLASTDTFSSFFSMLEGSGVDTLNNTGPFTLFAPNDDAFNTLSQTHKNLASALTNYLNGWFLHAASLINYHFTDGMLSSGDLSAGSLAMHNGQNIEVGTTNGITLTDVLGDKVSVVSPFDITVPTNGIIHSIDSVLLLPWTNTTILNVIQADGRFGTFINYANQVGVASILDRFGTKGYTLFIPTDMAFKNVTASQLNGVMVDDLIMYHIIPEVYPSARLSTGTLATVQGTNVNVSVSGNRIKVNTALVTSGDILASNGIVHVIDAVLIPAQGTLSPTMAPSSGKTSSFSIFATVSVLMSCFNLLK